MTGSSIKDIVKENLVDKQFTFSKELISNLAWESVAAVLFPHGTLSVGGATVKVVDNTVIVTGQTDFLKTKNVEVSVKFIENDDSKCDVDLTLTFDKASEPNLQDLLALFLPNVNDVPSISMSKLEVKAAHADGKYSLHVTLADWQLTIGSTVFNFTNMKMDADHTSERKFSPKLNGTLDLGTTKVKVTADDSDSFTFSGKIGEIKFEKLIPHVIPDSKDLPKALKDLSISNVNFSICPSDETFSFSSKGPSKFTFHIGTNGIEVTALKLEVSHSKGSKTTGTLTCTVKLDGMGVDLTCKLPGGFRFSSTLPKVTLGLQSLITELCGDSTLHIPNSIASLELRVTRMEVDLIDERFGMSADTDFGYCELGVGKNKEWEFVVGVQLSKSLVLSKIDGSLKAFDGLKLSAVCVIISTMNSENFEFANIKVPAGGVEKGVNIYARLPLKGSGVETLLPKESLTVQAAVDPDDDEASFSCTIDDSFKFANGVTFEIIKFTLSTKDENPSFGLTGGLLVTVPHETLDFDLHTTVSTKQVTGRGTMKTKWKNALGFKNVELYGLSITFGFDFTDMEPSLGISGAMKTNSCTGKAAVYFDGPKSMIDIYLSQLSLQEVAEMFCPPVYKIIPQKAWNTFLNVGMKSVDMYVVPVKTIIGDVEYDPGFRLEGTIYLWGWSGWAKIDIDESKGVTLGAELDPFSLGKVLTISGWDGKGPAVMDLEAKEESKVHISCGVKLLEIQENVKIKGSESGLEFELKQNIGSVIQVGLSCVLTGGSLAAKGSINFNFPKITTKPLTLDGVTVIDSIHLLDLSFDAHASLRVTSSPSFHLRISGQFTVYDTTITFPKLKINAAPLDFKHVSAMVKNKIEDEAEDLFGFLFSSPEKWLESIKDKTIVFEGDVAKVFKLGFRKGADYFATTMKDAGREINEIGDGLYNVYFPHSAAMAASALKSAEFGVKHLAKSVHHFYSTTKEDMTMVLHGLKYTANDVVSALNYTYSVSKVEAASLLKTVDYPANEVANALGSAYTMSANETMQVMTTAGYAAKDAANGIRTAGLWTASELTNLGDAVAGEAKNIGDTIGDTAKTVWSIMCVTCRR